MWFKDLWIRTKDVAKTYTVTFIVVILLNQLLFFGFCMNPICIVAAMPHCLVITVFIGTLLNLRNKSGKGKERKEERTITSELKEKGFYNSGRKNAKFERSIRPSNNHDGKIDKKRNEIEKHFEKHKCHPYLYYITHKQNIESILENGILNFYEAKKLNTNHIDISHPEVQNKREKVEEHYSRKIHDYAPLYFNPKNPMSRLRWKEYKNALCFLQVSVSALADGEFLISDGNAASPVTKFYKSLDQLDLLPWDVINAEYWNDLDDGSRKRCAEVLIYPKIKPEHIESIFCFSIDTKNYLEKFGKKIILREDIF